MYKHLNHLTRAWRNILNAKNDFLTLPKKKLIGFASVHAPDHEIK